MKKTLVQHALIPFLHGSSKTRYGPSFGYQQYHGETGWRQVEQGFSSFYAIFVPYLMIFSFSATFVSYLMIFQSGACQRLYEKFRFICLKFVGSIQTNLQYSKVASLFNQSEKSWRRLSALQASEIWLSPRSHSWKVTVNSPTITLLTINVKRQAHRAHLFWIRRSKVSWKACPM